MLLLKAALISVENLFGEQKSIDYTGKPLSHSKVVSVCISLSLKLSLPSLLSLSRINTYVSLYLSQTISSPLFVRINLSLPALYIPVSISFSSLLSISVLNSLSLSLSLFLSLPSSVPLSQTLSLFSSLYLKLSLSLSSRLSVSNSLFPLSICVSVLSLLCLKYLLPLSISVSNSLSLCPLSLSLSQILSSFSLSLSL